MSKNAKKGYVLDFQKEILIITKDWEKKAGVVGSDEYNTYLKLRNDYPNLKIAYKTTKHKGEHNKLTTKFMENYINTMLSPEYKEKILPDYEKLKEVYTFPKMKSWFIKTFPNYSTMSFMDKPLSANIESDNKTDKKESKVS